MKNFKLYCLIAAVSCISFAQAQVHSNKKPMPNYRLAAKYSPENLGKLVHSTTVSPRWLKNGNRFWYQYKTSEGSKYYIVDADRRTRTELFNNEKMAKWLTEITKDPYDAKHLPRFSFKFVKNETAIRFRVTATEEVEVVEEEKASVKKDTTSTKKAKKKKPKMEKKVYHFEYRLGGNGLTIVDNKKEDKKYQRWANIAPDSSMVLFSKNFNLYWMDKENFLKAVEDEKDTTIVEHQWTTDGIEHFSYGGSGRGENNETKEKNKDNRKGVGAIWSHDSKKFVLSKYDSRMLKDLWVINSVTKNRPTLETYKYNMAGEKEYSKMELHIFDAASKNSIKVPLDTVKQQQVSLYRAPRKNSEASDEFRPSLMLSKKGKVYFSTISRDRKKFDICVADINTGEVKVLIEERFNTYIESRNLVLFNNETEMLHWAERDGWAHFYLYDTQGNLKNQITKGSYHVANFVNIDERERVLYFNANGVDKNQDPYYAHLYRINLNGTGLKSLNPGDFTSSVSMSDSNRFFVSNNSTVSTIPTSELRSNSGALVMKLEEADLSQLFATGYQFPETFKMKADD